jgi:mercuric ion binding protein
VIAIAASLCCLLPLANKAPDLKGRCTMRKVALLLTLLVLPKAAVAADVTATLTIRNMLCATCSITVREAIAKVPGVKTVTVDFRKKLAVVTFDDTQATVDKLAAASRDAGFPAERRD